MKKRRNRVFSGLLLTLGGMGILDFVFLMSIGTVINVGVILPLFAGIFLVAYVPVTIYLEKYKPGIAVRPFVSRSLKWLVSILVVFILMIELMIVYAAKPDRGADVDYVIILGAGLKGDQITLTFKNRMNLALEYLRENPGRKVIVTGGQGNGETITEAEAMEAYLCSNGIAKDRIIKEKRATSTMENFKYTKELLPEGDAGNRYKVMVVTSDFHMFRSKILARRNGFVPYGLPSKTWIGVLPNCHIREYFAIIKSFLFDR